MADRNDFAESERLVGAVRESLDEAAPESTNTTALARRAWRSRTQFHRLFRALAREGPGAMRRRLLMERAAFALGHNPAAKVTDVALDAGYGSLEAFTRAFRRAYGVSPSLFRRSGATHFRLPAPNGIHFDSPGGACGIGIGIGIGGGGRSRSTKKGASDMDLFDRFAGYDSWHSRKLLRLAATLGAEQLDRQLAGTNVKLLPWEKRQRTLREMLERMVGDKEIWTAALAGREFRNPDSPLPPEQCTPAGMLARFESADADFNAIMSRVRDSGAWDDVFVDALCEPPETFTFGGTFAHYITFASCRRLAVQDALRALGVNDSGLGCPSEYEEEVAPWRDRRPAGTAQPETAVSR